MDFNEKGEVSHVLCLQIETDKLISLSMHLAKDETYMQTNGCIIQDPEYDAFIHSKKADKFIPELVIGNDTNASEEVEVEITQKPIVKRGRKKQTA